MRKRISKQEEQEKASISLKKILIMTVIVLIITGMMGVMATNQKLTNVKILLSSGYEMNVMTTSSKVSDILAENNIIVLKGESVTPNMDEELSDNKTITITKGNKNTNKSQDYMSAQEILDSYTKIVEKVITEEVEIPFETVTKDVSNASSSTQDRVVQSGENGIKRVTYKIRYQNGNEIDRTEISSEIIKQPVEKIVEVRTKKVTSRSSVSSGSQIETIWAVVRQEGGSSYESALAVASSAMNRTKSSRWSSKGSTMYEQLTAAGQYCYSLDRNWVKYLGGNVPEHVKRAVSDALDGKTNHPYTCFRGSYVAGGVNIGGNYYFGN